MGALYCGFCGKHQNTVEVLIAGPTDFICAECVDLCAAIVAEKRAKQAAMVAATIGWIWPIPDLRQFIPLGDAA